MRTMLLALCTLSAYGSEVVFEAASIKPSPPIDSSRGPVYFGPKGGPGSEDPGRYWCNFCNISELIAQAYDLPEYRIFTATRFSEGRFHVVATIAGGTTREQFRTMLQNLLAQRFRLIVHFEARDMQAFRLVVSPGGSKLTSHAERTTPAPPLTQEKRAPNPRPAGFYYRVESTSTSDLARVIEGQLRRPVRNATGLNGTYDFDLFWTAGNPDADVTAATDSPTIYTALQALGLRLESRKEPVQVVVVERVEKLPSLD